MVQERDGQDTVTATYTYGNYIDEPLTFTSAQGTLYYHTNNLYNVRALTDENGAVVERYRYSAYGEVTVLDPNDQELSESAVGNVYMFQGRRLDPETGLYYYRNRMMSAGLGRFLQRDPLGYVDGYNLYEYVGGHAVNAVDPMGLSFERLYDREYGPPQYGPPQWLVNVLRDMCTKAGGSWAGESCCCGGREFAPSTHDCRGGNIVPKYTTVIRESRGGSIPLSELPPSTAPGYIETQALTLGASFQPDSRVAQAVAQTNADIYNAALLQHGIMSAGKHLAQVSSLSSITPLLLKT